MKILVCPWKSENALISREDFIKLRDLVGVTSLEKNPRMLTVPVYSSAAANFPNMEELHEHYQRPVWQPREGLGFFTFVFMSRK